MPKVIQYKNGVPTLVTPPKPTTLCSPKELETIKRLIIKIEEKQVMGVKKKNRIRRDLYINNKGKVISCVKQSGKQTKKFIKLLNNGTFDQSIYNSKPNKPIQSLKFGEFKRF